MSYIISSQESLSQALCKPCPNLRLLLYHLAGWPQLFSTHLCLSPSSVVDTSTHSLTHLSSLSPCVCVCVCVSLCLCQTHTLSVVECLHSVPVYVYIVFLTILFHRIVSLSITCVKLSLSTTPSDANHMTISSPLFSLHVQEQTMYPQRDFLAPAVHPYTSHLSHCTVSK